MTTHALIVQQNDPDGTLRAVLKKFLSDNDIEVPE